MNKKIQSAMDALWNRGMPLDGEREDIESALKVARQWGYGNLMAWLATEWALKLIHEHGLDKESAIKAVRNRGPYTI